MNCKKIITTALFVCLLIWSVSISGNCQALSTRIANYNMKVKLDPVEKIVDGTMILEWKNPSQDTIRELRFHMYLNAFKNNRSTFWKESGGQLRGKGVDTKDPKVWGWVDILSLKTLEGIDLTNSIQFVQPDDDNADDQTVAEVKLENPVLPGGNLTLNIEFRSKLPKIFARSGFSDNYFLVAQWFPKIGVYEQAGMRYAEKGQWNCHQYHANSEFYANFGVYHVEVTVPEKFVVGATGKRISEKPVEDGLKQVTYLAEDVVDFAWTTSPRFIVAEDKWEDVDIKVYLQPEHEQLAFRHTESVKAALDYFKEHLGPYPYSTVSVVDPPFRGLGSAGMEYPTFFTAGSLWGLPDELRLTEMVTIHEFGHTYFMGILATNEFEEAWMDEGMNTYFESRIMDHSYGEGTSYVGFKKFHFDDKENQRLSYTRSSYPKIAESTRPAWKFEHGGYGLMSYQKPATMFTTLERLVGEETNEEIWKTYFKKWKFKHPSGKDFIRVVNEVVTKNHGTRFGKNMDWYFDQFLYGSEVCDYKLLRIRNNELTPPKGIDDSGDNKLIYKKTEYENIIYKSSVVIHRLGEAVIPQEVLIHFEDGEEITETWDGKSRTKEFFYEKPEKIIWAKIDPENKIMLDINLQNNSRAVEPQKTVFNKYLIKFIFLMQNLLQDFAIFI